VVLEVYVKHYCVSPIFLEITVKLFYNSLTIG
jgi:hypothetical protein